MDGNCIIFGVLNIARAEIEGRRVLEVGSCDVNGSLRPILESYKPGEYIGVDIAPGPQVDLCCKVEELIQRFGENSFDAVVSTEMLEHVQAWQEAIHNMKAVCKPNGSILLTTRSFGFPYHGYPYDFWRFEIEDMRKIFSDFQIDKLEKDPYNGVMIKARKPANYREADLSGYKLYSIVLNRKAAAVTERDLNFLPARSTVFKEKVKDLLLRWVRKI